jgi:hypothetical protein
MDGRVNRGGDPCSRFDELPMLSFAKSASDSGDDDPCSRGRPGTPGDCRQQVGGRAVGSLGAIGPATERGGARDGTASGLTGGGRRAWRAGGAGRAGDARSRRARAVAMMQVTNFGNLDHHATLRPLDWPSVGCIFVERQVSARPGIVRESSGSGGSAGGARSGPGHDPDTRAGSS